MIYYDGPIKCNEKQLIDFLKKVIFLFIDKFGMSKSQMKTLMKQGGVSVCHPSLCKSNTIIIKYGKRKFLDTNISWVNFSYIIDDLI
jgi:hypothetical protein